MRRRLQRGEPVRPTQAYELEDRAAGSRILDAHGELTTLLQQATYGIARKQRIIELPSEPGLARSDTAEFAILRRIRGALL